MPVIENQLTTSTCFIFNLVSFVGFHQYNKIEINFHLQKNKYKKRKTEKLQIENQSDFS